MGGVFCLFLLETFLVQVCAKLKNSVGFLISFDFFFFPFLFFFVGRAGGLFLYKCVSKTKNACHLESEVQSGCIKDHSIGRAWRGVSVYRIDRPLRGPHGILRLQVFCFLVKEKGRSELSRRLNLITKRFLFSSCVGGMVHL